MIIRPPDRSVEGPRSPRVHAVLAAVLPVALLLPLGGCFADRGRPGPVAPNDTVIVLTTSVLEPANGATLPTGQDISVRVNGSAEALNLQGVGFVARRLAPGMPLVDSAAVRFPPRGDSTHVFTFQVPDTFPTNTQVDIHGISFGPFGAVDLSEPVHIVVVQCAGGACD